jgi:parallel beta-helix repeat protein
MTPLTIITSGRITNAISFAGANYLIQTTDSDHYQAINETNGSIVSASSNASYLINSMIEDNVCIILGLGTFILTSPITKQADNVTIEGQGEETHLKTATLNSVNVFELKSVFGWAIDNLCIDGSNSAIFCVDSADINVENDYINNSRYNAIELFSSSNCVVANNMIFNSSKGFAIQFWNTSNSQIINNVADFTYWSVIAVSDGSSYNRIVGNLVSRGGQNGTLGDGIEIGSGPQSVDVIGNVVTNNTAYNNVIDGISVSQTRNTEVYSNNVYGNGVQGISLENSNIGTQIISNSIFNNSATSKVGAAGILINGPNIVGTTVISNSIHDNWKYGIFVIQGSQNTTISHNTVYNNGQKMPNEYYGIYIATSNNLVESNACFDNQQYTTQKYGIGLDGGYTNNLFVGNVFS